MPQIQPMYFHRHTLRGLSEKFVYTIYIFNRKMNISAFAKVFYKQIYKKFYWNLTKTRHLQPFPCTSEPSAGQRSTSLYDVTWHFKPPARYTFVSGWVFLTKDPWLSTFLCLCIQLSNADTPYQFSQNCSSTCWTCVTISCGEHARQVIFRLS